LHAAIEETQQLIKRPRTKVREEKKWGGVFPGHNKVKAVIERHLGVVRENQLETSEKNISVWADSLRQSGQRHPGGKLLRARRQYHASSCISPSDRHFAVSSRSVGLLF
jgi:hypothetical protein